MSVTLLDSWTDISTTLTIPDISEGDNRKAVIVVARNTGSSTASMISGLTIGGVAATYEGGFPVDTTYNRCTVGVFTLNEAQIALMSGNSVSTTGGSGEQIMMTAATIQGCHQAASVSDFLHIDSSVTSGAISLSRVADSYTVYAVSRNVAFSLTMSNPSAALAVTPATHRLYVGSATDTENTSESSYTSSGAGRSAQVIINFPPAAPAGPSINPEGTDTTLVNGSSQQISFTGLTATPTSVSLVYDGNVFEQPNFSIGAVTEGVATANFTAAIGNLPYTSAVYPASGFSYLVTMDNGTELTLSGVTINPSADRSVVTAVNPVNDSTSIIPSWLEGGAVTGDQIDWPKVVGNIQPTVSTDFTHSGARIDDNIPWPDSIKFTVNYWDSITSIRYAVTVEVAYAEDGTGTVIGITTRELTTRSLTVRNLTMRSL